MVSIAQVPGSGTVEDAPDRKTPESEVKLNPVGRAPKANFPVLPKSQLAPKRQSTIKSA